ncbi:MAG: alkaline phosphatase [Anaeromyxobacter sp.]
MNRRQLLVRLSVAAAVLCTAGAASAQATNVAVFPPNGARFLPGQRFDIRVEGKGAAPYSASLKVDGRPVNFTSGALDHVATDGISPAGWGGFNVRGFSLHKPGTHVLEATFVDGSGVAVTRTSFVGVEDVGGDDGRGGRDERDGRRGGGIKNVVIFLGDGMGVAHRTAGRIVSRGVTGGTPNGRLAMDTMPGVGLVSTHSLNSIITDSAPGMSCYTTGNHQNNNQEGVWPATVTNPFYAPRIEYLGHYLHRTRGTSLGIVTTADIEDATPAANAVFTQARGNGTGIIDQYLDESDASGTGEGGTGLRVLMGGGRRWFLPATDAFSSRADGSDYGPLPADLLAGWKLPASAAGGLDKNRDVIGGFQAAGFGYVSDAAGLQAVSSNPPKKLLGLFAYGNMNVALDKISARRFRAGQAGYSDAVVQDHLSPDQPMLDEMTKVALDVLRKDRQGFVLMVEGAHIDKQSHQMDAERAIGEVLEFDRAIAAALDFARQDGHTLVLVTADHECSGFALIGGLNTTIANLKATPSDAATLDPATAPKRQGLVGVYDAAKFPAYAIQPDGYPATYDIDGKLLVGFGASGDRYENWLTPTRPSRESLTPAALSTLLSGKGYASSPVGRSEKADGAFLRGQAVGKEQAVHTASDVALSAYARDPEAWLPFAGTYENTDVFFKIASVMERRGR